MNKFLIFICLCPLFLQAQNTIGGVKASVPESEVKRQSQFLVAERERTLNHHQKALELYKKFTYDFPEVDAGWYGLARCYTTQKELANALDAIQKAVTLAPDNQWYSIYQADLFETTGRMLEAVAVYDGLIKRFPETPEFYEKLAYLNLKNEDPKKALKALDKWEDLVGVNEDISFKKHVVYVGMGDNKKAGQELKKLCDAFPKEIKYRYKLAEFYQQNGDKANANLVYEEILRRDQNDPVARLALAGNQNGSQQNKLQSLKPLFDDPAVSIDDKIKALMPYFPDLEKGADPALLTQLFELGALVEKHHPDNPKTWSLTGDMYYMANRADEALPRYKRCISLNPAVFSVWENTLNILAATRNFDEMLSTAEKAMDAFPNQPRAYFYYGAAANIKGRYNDAIDQLEQGLLMAVNNNNMRLDIVEQIGLALIGKKDYAAAIARYEQVLGKGADQHPGILEHLGDAYSLSGQDARAVEYWKKANNLRRSPLLEQKISSGKL